MRKYFSLIIAVLFVASCQMPLILNEEQKNADAVYLSLNEEFLLKSNGEQEYTNSSRLLLQTHAAFNRLYGDSHIDYDPMFQEVEVIKAETENSMGKSIVRDNAINDILPKAAQKSAYYNRLRTKVVSHMGTELGAIINFDYKINSNSKYKPGLFENVVIGKEIPLKEYKLSVIVPNGEKLSYKLLNSEIKPLVEKYDNGEKYTWKFNDLLAVSHEKSEPQYKSEVIRLVFSTVSDFNIKKLISKSIKQKLESEIINASKQIVEGIESKQEKLLRLQTVVRNNIAFNDVSFEQGSYRVRNSKRIWNEANASAIEKAILLTDMLNAVGLESKLLVAVPDKLIDHADINPNVWGKSYVYIDSINNGMLINANTSNLYSSNLCLNGHKLYDPQSGSIVNMFKEMNTIDGKIKININSKKIIWGDAEIECSGICKHTLKEGNVKYIKNMLDYSFRYKKRNRKYIYYLEDNSKKLESNHFSIELPVFHTGFSSYGLPVLLDFRKAPLEIKGSIDERYVYSLVCNKRYRMINNLNSLTKENKVGKVLFNISKEDGKYSIEKRLVINKAVISSQEYSLFKELIDIWTDKKYNTIYYTAN